MRDDRAREALERATDGLSPDVGRLLDNVPHMMREAARRRDRRRARSVLAASIPPARRAIPRLAAATALLVAIGAVLWLSGAQTTSSDGAADIGDLIVSGSGPTDRLIVERILEPEREQ